MERHDDGLGCGAFWMTDDPERRCHSPWDIAGMTEWRQRDKGCAIRKAPFHVFGYGNGQPRLANAARSQQAHEPHMRILQEGANLCYLLLASIECG